MISTALQGMLKGASLRMWRLNKKMIANNPAFLERWAEGTLRTFHLTRQFANESVKQRVAYGPSEQVLTEAFLKADLVLCDLPLHARVIVLARLREQCLSDFLAKPTH